MGQSSVSAQPAGLASGQRNVDAVHDLHHHTHQDLDEDENMDPEARMAAHARHCYACAHALEVARQVRSPGHYILGQDRMAGTTVLTCGAFYVLEATDCVSLTSASRLQPLISAGNDTKHYLYVCFCWPASQDGHLHLITLLLLLQSNDLDQLGTPN